MSGASTFLVTKTSATSCCRHWETGPEHICAIGRNHSDMVKFGAHDPEYEKVHPRLRGLVQRATARGLCDDKVLVQPDLSTAPNAQMNLSEIEGKLERLQRTISERFSDIEQAVERMSETQSEMASKLSKDQENIAGPANDKKVTKAIGRAKFTLGGTSSGNTEESYYVPRVTGKAQMKSEKDNKDAFAGNMEENYHVPRGTGTAQKKSEKDNEAAFVPSTIYSCDSITGIDDALFDDGRGTSTCLFCGKTWTQEEADFSFLPGQHLAREHRFGDCNLNVSYRDWNDLEAHLISFHGWMKPADTSESETAKARFRTKSRLLHGKLLRLDDSWSQPVRRPDHDEVTSSHFLGLHALNVILGEARLGIPRIPSNLSNLEVAHQLCLSLAMLDKLLITDKPPQIDMTDGDLSRIAYRAACAEEELTVSGFEDLRYEKYYSFDQSEVEEVLWLYGMGPWLRNPTHSWVFSISESEKQALLTCDDCLTKRTYQSYREGIIHLFSNHSKGLDFHKSIPELLAVGSTILVKRRVGLGSGDVGATGHLDQGTIVDLVAALGKSTSGDEITKWLWGMFLDSPAFRRLLRSGRAFQGGGLTRSSRPWAISILKCWDDTLPLLRQIQSQSPDGSTLAADFGSKLSDWHVERG